LWTTAQLTKVFVNWSVVIRLSFSCLSLVRLSLSLVSGHFLA